MQLIGTHGSEVIYFGGVLGFLNCDDIYMCVVNKDVMVAVTDACTIVCVAWVYAERVRG